MHSTRYGRQRTFPEMKQKTKEASTTSFTLLGDLGSMWHGHKRGLRGRNSPMCTLSQNGYGDRNLRSRTWHCPKMCSRTSAARAKALTVGANRGPKGPFFRKSIEGRRPFFSEKKGEREREGRRPLGVRAGQLGFF